jgi:hypothetical protein
MPRVSSSPTSSRPAPRDQLGVRRPVVGAAEARAPAPQAGEEAFERGSVTTAAPPVDRSPRSTIPSLPDPGLGLPRVILGEPPDPGHHAGRGHARKLGRAVHRRAADVEQDGGDLDPERHPARRRVGEVQAAGPAAAALLAAHGAVLGPILAAAPLASRPHRPAGHHAADGCGWPMLA